MTQQKIVQLERLESFSAAHRIHSEALSAEENVTLFGKCNNANFHGHNYRWLVTLRGPVDPVTGMVYNLADLKQEMSAVLDLVDHKNINLDVEYFRVNKVVATSENLTIFLYNELKSQMKCPDLLYKVKLWETDKNSFVYKG